MRIVMLSGEGPDSADVPIADAPANDTFVMKPFDFTVLLDVIAVQLGIEWLRAAGAPRAAAAGEAGLELPHLPGVITPVAAAHCAEIERLVRIGHVRAIEA